MPVTYTALTSGADNTGGTTPTTASITPTNNSLVLIAIASYSSLTPTSVVGNGVTYTLVNSATSHYGLLLYRGLSSSWSAGTIVITYASSPTRCCWSIAEFANVDTGGTNGANAVVQSAKSTYSGGSSTFTATLAAFGSANNATYGCTAHGSTVTPGSGFTEISEASTTGSVAVIQSEFRNDNDTTVDSSGSGSFWASIIGVEIKYSAGGGGGATNPGWMTTSRGWF